jgi:hypothetical protein
MHFLSLPSIEWMNADECLGRACRRRAVAGGAEGGRVQGQSVTGYGKSDRANWKRRRLARAAAFNTVSLRCNDQAYLGDRRTPIAWFFSATAHFRNQAPIDF